MNEPFFGVVFRESNVPRNFRAAQGDSFLPVAHGEGTGQDNVPISGDVMPAPAGVQLCSALSIPACAGMTPCAGMTTGRE